MAWARINPFGVPRTRWQWVGDSALFAVALLLWWWTGVTAHAYPAVPDWFWPVDRVLGLVACLALWWTRTAPVASALVLIVPGALALSGTLPLVLGIFRLGKFAAPRWSVPVTGLHLATALPYHALFPLPGMDWLAWLVVIPLVYLLSLSLGLLGRARRLVIEGLAAEAAHERDRHQAELGAVRRTERERIASEMHDVLAHRISLVSVHAGALEYRTAESSVPPSAAEVHAAAAIIRDNAHLAVEELGQVLALLRADGSTAGASEATAPPQPRFSDIPRLIEEAEVAGQRIDTRIDGLLGASLNETAQRTVYRIVQEGLTNARKHAPGARVSLRIEPIENAARIELSNPVHVGVTQNEIPGIGSGLAGLSERVRIAGGRLDAGVSADAFRLVATVPASGR